MTSEPTSEKNKKPLHKMTMADRFRELLNDEPKTLFRIMQLLPGTNDGPPDPDDDALSAELHKAKFVCVKTKDMIVVEASNDNEHWTPIVSIYIQAATKGVFFPIPDEVHEKFKFWRQHRIGEKLS